MGDTLFSAGCRKRGDLFRIFWEDALPARLACLCWEGLYKVLDQEEDLFEKAERGLPSGKLKKSRGGAEGGSQQRWVKELNSGLLVELKGATGHCQQRSRRRR